MNAGSSASESVGPPARTSPGRGEAAAALCTRDRGQRVRRGIKNSQNPLDRFIEKLGAAQGSVQ